MTRSLKKTAITLSVNEDLKLILRSATINDLENLRRWKNEQRKFFFYKEEITPGQQYSWFNEFQKRLYDYMFIIELNGLDIGCMGIRWLESHWDIYNVILGNSEFGRKGYMGSAFKTMLAYALSVKYASITLQVLKNNPSVKWYIKNDFVVTTEYEDHYEMKYVPRKAN